MDKLFLARNNYIQIMVSINKITVSINKNILTVTPFM